VTDPMTVCDPDVHAVCPCLDYDDEDPYSCACEPADGPALRCERCGVKLIVIDADSGRRLAS